MKGNCKVHLIQLGIRIEILTILKSMTMIRRGKYRGKKVKLITLLKANAKVVNRQLKSKAHQG